MARVDVDEVVGRDRVHVVEKFEKFLSHEYTVRDKDTRKAESEGFRTRAEAYERAQQIAKKK